MNYGLLADALGLIHAGFVLFVVGGLAAVLAGWRFRWRWTERMAFRLAHLAAIGFQRADHAGPAAQRVGLVRENVSVPRHELGSTRVKP